MTPFEDVGNGVFSYALCKIGFCFILGHSAPHAHLMIEEQSPCCKMARPTEWLVETKVKELMNLGPERGCCVLDSAFHAHLCLVFFRRRDSESVPAVIAAYSRVRRL